MHIDIYADERMEMGKRIKNYNKHFEFYSMLEADTFEDAWRVFSKDTGKLPRDLPEKTSV